VTVIRDGRPSPALLQQRLQCHDPAEVARLAREAPLTLMVYDLLRIGDSWLLDVNLEERREILTRALRPSASIRIPAVEEDGAMALTRAQGLGLDAVVAKRRKGRYYPGDRTREWLNIRPLDVLEAIICGWTEGKGARSATIGTLLLGAYRQGDLVYVGHTGTGLDAETLRLLHQELVEGPTAENPFREPLAGGGEAHWAPPRLACRIRHQGWTEHGKLRSPTFLELAPELQPGDCRIPKARAKVGVH
jgi:bifunctional non-homologous end joining protein LigD